MLRRLYFDIGTMYLFAIWIMYLLYFKLCILKIRICANTRLSPVTYCFLIRSDNNGSRRAKFFPPTIPHSAKWKSQKGRWMLMCVFMDVCLLYFFLRKSQKGHCLYLCFSVFGIFVFKKIKGTYIECLWSLVYLYLCRTNLEILKHLLLWIFWKVRFFCGTWQCCVCLSLSSAWSSDCFQLFSCDWNWKLNSLSVTDE